MTDKNTVVHSGHLLHKAPNQLTKFTTVCRIHNTR